MWKGRFLLTNGQAFRSGIELDVPGMTFVTLHFADLESMTSWVFQMGFSVYACWFVDSTTGRKTTLAHLLAGPRDGS